MRVMNRRRDQDGNLIVAVSVIMVLMLLSVAVLTRTLSGLTSARQGQDFNGALAQADAGLSDALFRMDQQGNAAASSFCVGTSGSCGLPSVPGAAGVQYTARRLDDNTYTVLAKGTVNGRPHAIQATVARPASLFPFALWGTTSVDIHGAKDGGVTTVYPPGWTGGTVRADIGSDGQITCNGNGNPADDEDYYKGGGTNCPAGVLLSGSYTPANPARSCPPAPNTPPTPCLPSGAQLCPGNGTLDGSGTPVTLTPGVYVCYDSVSWTGNINVAPGPQNGGVVEIFLFPQVKANPTFDLTNATVNSGGDATKLRVYVSGAYTVDPGNGSHGTSFDGALYAPHASLTSNGCKAAWVGSVFVDSFTCNGGPHLSVQYDARLSQVRPPGGWTTSNWTEIPSNQFSLP
jgi:hypothetical protein